MKIPVIGKTYYPRTKKNIAPVEVFSIDEEERIVFIKSKNYTNNTKLVCSINTELFKYTVDEFWKTWK